MSCAIHELEIFGTNSRGAFERLTQKGLFLGGDSLKSAASCSKTGKSGGLFLCTLNLEEDNAHIEQPSSVPSNATALPMLRLLTRISSSHRAQCTYPMGRLAVTSRSGPRRLRKRFEASSPITPLAHEHRMYVWVSCQGKRLTMTRKEQQICVACHELERFSRGKRQWYSALTRNAERSIS